MFHAFPSTIPSLPPQADIIPMDTLRDYIAFARATCFPQLQPEAANVSCVGRGGWLWAGRWRGVALPAHGMRVQPPISPPSSHPSPLPPYPALSPQALSQAYVEMRSMGMSRKIVSATPRQLESLIRLSGGWGQGAVGE